MRKSRLICVALDLLVAAAAFEGQQASAAHRERQPSAVPAVTMDAPGGLIHLDAVVLSSTGQRVSGLRREDFTLLDNGQPEPILSFQAVDATSAAPEARSRLILVIDEIDIPPKMQDRLSDEHVAVEHYLLKNRGRLTRPVSVYLINDRGLWTVEHPAGDGNAMVHDLVHNQLKLIRSFAARPSTDANSGVGPHDTVAMSTLKSIGQIAAYERPRPGRKLMVWVGPGVSVGKGLYGFGGPLNEVRAKMTNDNLDAIYWFSLLMREARIAFYTLTVFENDPRAQSGQTEKYLNGLLLGGGLEPPKGTYMSRDRKVLAIDSGGLVMEGSFAILQQIESCVRDADTFYTLTFDPAHADAPNEYHDLKLLVDKPGLTARTNSGYYDQPWYGVARYPAAHAVTVKQLKQIVATDRSEPDAQMAQQLAELELTERLSTTKTASLMAETHGKRSRQALKILADASAFLDPPSDEILTTPPPDSDAQQRMLALTAEYLRTTLHKLPNYLARQTTVRYQEMPKQPWGQTQTAYQPLHAIDAVSATVLYRNGVEVEQSKKRKGHKRKNDPGLVTYGTFGPVLEGLWNSIAQHASLKWSRWEQSEAGPVAVFNYAVPAKSSRYETKACCLPDGDGRGAFLHYVGYHGEVALDPQTGTIIRLEWSADLKSTTPVAESKILIEYGPVEIGGTRYILPLRSVSAMRARSVMDFKEWDESFLTYGPYATKLNVTEFSNYHMFGSTLRILPGFTPE